MSSSSHLTWSLVIATYKRAHILPQCIEAALQQSHQPIEIIIIDASPNWEIIKKTIEKLIANNSNTIAVHYKQANKASLTAQRNQGIDQCQGDIAFMIDDDSLMYPDCAEHVMALYQADLNNEIVGVQITHSSTPPASKIASTQYTQLKNTNEKNSPLRRLIKKILNTENTYFLPYEPNRIEKVLSNDLKAMGLKKIPVMVGYAMTFRKSVFMQERFCEALIRYAAGEDQDFSYRASRHGALVVAAKAKLCHLEISGGRLSDYQVALLSGLNPAVLQSLYSEELSLMKNKWKMIILKRIVINLIKDVAEKKWRLKRTKGNIKALQMLNTVYQQPQASLTAWYTQLQENIINNQ